MTDEQLTEIRKRRDMDYRSTIPGFGSVVDNGQMYDDISALVVAVEGWQEICDKLTEQIEALSNEVSRG